MPPTKYPNVKMSFQDYLLMVVQKKEHYPSQRMGQAYFNVLDEIWPEKANAYRGSWLDPFHNDGRIGSFLYDLCATWEEGYV